ncbi:hypothetical protein [Thiorhodococcus minor]|uniref:Uncharacterized protein n=1 Tax=Thiorhodococcus minor TaxID=57489 RepID=A0A6M0K144_9GAMM|nr:hypothetical protein [Thiorhodococcus minor]NEV63486.1 hypothetical protein [Thiorhodococcus minor]
MEARYSEARHVLVETCIEGAKGRPGCGDATELSVGQTLILQHAVSPASSAAAVEILSSDLKKLGEVAEGPGGDIARQLSLVAPVRCRLTHVARQGDAVCIRVEVEVPRDADALTVPAQAERPTPVGAVAIGAEPYQLSAIKRCLANASQTLIRGERLSALHEMSTALSWALDLWAARHPDQVARHLGWSQRLAAFMRDWPDPLRRRTALLAWVILSLTQEGQGADAEAVIRRPSPSGPCAQSGDDEIDFEQLEQDLHAWTSGYCGPPGSTGRSERLKRLDWALLSEVRASTAVLAAPADASPAEDTSLTASMTVSQREEILRALFRWIKLIEDHRRLGVIPISRMKAMRRLNWDTDLVISLQAETLRALIDGAPHGAEAERAYLQGRERIGPTLFPIPPVSFSEKRSLLERALTLMVQRPRPASELLAMAEALRRIQPRLVRRKRRRIRHIEDEGLYLAECFARNAASSQPDIYVTLRLLAVCQPYRQLNELVSTEMEDIAERLAQRYFGMSHDQLGNALPPTALAATPDSPEVTWLWRDSGALLRPRASYKDLIEKWHELVHWIGDPGIQWSRPELREHFRQGLHLRTLIRDQILLGSPRVARRARRTLDEADFDLLACTQHGPHAWGADWELAYGHRPSAHWWYYRRPLGMTDHVRSAA